MIESEQYDFVSIFSEIEIGVRTGMTNPPNPELGKKLLQLRKEFKMTQDDVANILGMSRTSFSKYENGYANPPLQVMRKLANIYNVGLEYLIFDDNTLIKLNDPQEEDENSADAPLSRITDLRPIEKEIVGKFRTLSEKDKEKFLKKLFPERTKKD